MNSLCFKEKYPFHSERLNFRLIYPQNLITRRYVRHIRSFLLFFFHVLTQSSFLNPNTTSMISKQDKIRGNTFQFRSTTTHVAFECPVYRFIFDGRSCVSNYRCSNRIFDTCLFDVRMSSFCLASFLAILLRNDYSFLFPSIILTFLSHSGLSIQRLTRFRTIVYHFTRECA